MVEDELRETSENLMRKPSASVRKPSTRARPGLCDCRGGAVIDLITRAVVGLMGAVVGSMINAILGSMGAVVDLMMQAFVSWR